MGVAAALAEEVVMRRMLGSIAVSLVGAFMLAAGCNAGGEIPPKGNGGSGNGGASAGGAGMGGEIALTTSGTGSGTGGASGCQHIDITFEPQTPTVLLLVDRSGSMFDSGAWDPLKTAVLNVVEGAQGKVRFGLLTFTGIIGQACPLVTETDIALQNHAAIKAVYDAASVKPGSKLETPTGMTIQTVAVPKLVAVTDPGDKYLLFVTDGEPDRCDDGTPECARDDVIGAVQAARQQGIGTLVFGLGSGVFAQHLQDVANAGAGAPVASPGDNALYACFSGNWANAKGTYAASGGTTKYYTPNPTDSAALETALSAAVAGTKSCTFDLQGKIEVDLAHADQGKVLIDGTEVPYDGTNGWSMAGPTTLVLAGAACEKLKGATQGISFDFPCEILLPK
ncbi:putative secreted protein [Minicystis rosea]|nr:putative secreted protein [Minicystis rosea]